MDTPDNDNVEQTKPKAPAPTISAPPGRDLEQRLKLNPDDQDAKTDVGSDQSMDASDPPSTSHPGQCDSPAPSSGFPE